MLIKYNNHLLCNRKTYLHYDLSIFISDAQIPILTKKYGNIECIGRIDKNQMFFITFHQDYFDNYLWHVWMLKKYTRREVSSDYAKKLENILFKCL